MRSTQGLFFLYFFTPHDCNRLSITSIYLCILRDEQKITNNASIINYVENLTFFYIKVRIKLRKLIEC